MVVRDHYPAGVPCWIDLLPPDPAAAAEFYGGLFGWTFEERVPAEVPGSYLIASLDGLVVGAIGSPDDASQPVRWNTYVAVDDADTTANVVREAGGSVVVEPHDVNVAGRTASIADPAGAVVHLWQPGARKGVQVVNAPGSWNWSNLATPDADTALAFYGRVFGWRPVPVELGDFKATLLALPGYGDFLAELEPEIRERQSGEGAPEGFADAIAWLQPADTPEWTISFAVADTEATATRAVELGGTVVMPPFDAGSSQVATLADPAGAVLTVATWAPSEA